VKKIVAARTLPASPDPKVHVVGDDIAGALRAAKQQPGGESLGGRGGRGGRGLD